VLYQPGEDSSQIRVLLEGETGWLTQHQIADLHQTTQQSVSLHVRNIYEEGELAPEATHKDFLLVRQEGKRQVRRRVDHFNLDAILAVGYRVKSPVPTAFRQWATAGLKRYLVKGFTLNDERLKGTDGVTDYFDELLARIRDICASEARGYKILELLPDGREIHRLFGMRWKAS